MGEKEVKGIHSKTKSVSGLMTTKAIEDKAEITIARMLIPEEVFLFFLKSGINPLSANEINGGRITSIKRVSGVANNFSSPHSINFIGVNCIGESFYEKE